MPPRSSKHSHPPRPSGQITDYLLDEDFADGDPFRASSPEDGGKKSKQPDALGIDEAVEIKKRARAPRVKLDEERLISEKGLPELRKRAKRLKLKGKGHEFSDAARLLSLYQLWLDDLFPKARFLDALAMVEKTGHKKTMRIRRLDWINEGKPKTTSLEEDEDFRPDGGAREADRLTAGAPRIAPIFELRPQTAERPGGGRPGTPTPQDLFGEEDIYDATPRARMAVATGRDEEEEPDEDIDALMAMAEAEKLFNDQRSAPKPASGNPHSIFGGDGPTREAPAKPSGDPEDDLDALMAEAAPREPTRGEGSWINSDTGTPGVFGGEKGKKRMNQDDDGDLDALIAEAESYDQGETASRNAARPPVNDFADDEEAMAEMEGLWD